MLPVSVNNMKRDGARAEFNIKQLPILYFSGCLALTKCQEELGVTTFSAIDCTPLVDHHVGSVGGTSPTSSVYELPCWKPEDPRRLAVLIPQHITRRVSFFLADVLDTVQGKVSYTAQLGCEQMHAAGRRIQGRDWGASDTSFEDWKFTLV